MNFFADSLPAYWHRVPEILSTLPIPVDESLLENPLTGPSLRNYLLLTHSRDLLNELRAESEDVFWSRYYWLIRLAQTSRAIAGCDPGIEEMAFQVLECPYPTCSPDWSNGVIVEKAARRDANDDFEGQRR